MKARGRKQICGILFLLWVLFFSSIVTAEETVPPGTENKDSEYNAQLSLGYRYVDHHDYEGKVGEYDPLDSGVDAALQFSGNSKTTYFDLKSRFRANDDQEHSLDLDLSRIFRSETEYSRFIHFLDHDPLKNQVSHTDFNPGKDNIIIRSELKSKNRFIIPSLPFMQFNADYRLMTKMGHEQATTVSDCSTCHVISRSKRINQSTQDFQVGAQAKLGFATLSYNHFEREFREGADAPQADYGSSYGVFPVSGVQPYSQVPDTETITDKISGQFQLPYRSSLYSTYVNGKNESRETDDDRDFKNFFLLFRSLPWKFLNFTWKYRNYDMDNDAPGALTRDVTMMGFEVVSRLRKWVTLKGGYEWEDTDRNHSSADTTEKKTLKAAVLCRPYKTVNLNFHYKNENVDDPFVAYDALYQQYRTNLPTDTNEWSVDLTWTPKSTLSFLASYRLEDMDNDDLSWYDNRKTILFSTWLSINERLTVTGTYSYQERDTRTDVTYQSTFMDGPIVFTDGDVPYDERTNSFFLNLKYQYNPKLSFTGDFEYTDSKSHFNSTYLGNDLGHYSDLSIQQLSTSFGVNYLLRKDLSLYGRYTFRDYNDREENSLDGSAHIINFGLTWNFALL